MKSINHTNHSSDSASRVQGARRIGLPPDPPLRPKETKRRMKYRLYVDEVGNSDLESSEGLRFRVVAAQEIFFEANDIDCAGLSYTYTRQRW